MHRFWRRSLRVALLAGAAIDVCGCGGKTGILMQNPPPITVTLDQSQLTVSQSGTAVLVQIFIDSTSETALVNFTGMPGGVVVTYHASDTSPSGLLTFVAGQNAQLGTYMPIITAQSAGQTASTTFTLVVVDKNGLP